MPPLISVITAVYNGSEHILETIESVFGQDYKNIEYIIIDGGSTDGTQALIEKYSDKLSYYVSEPDKGIADAWNKGLAVAKGEYVTFLNADDYYAPSFIRRSLSKEKREGLHIVYGNTIIITEDGRYEDVIVPRFKGGRVRFGFGFRHPSCLTHRSVFDAVGGFDVDVKIACDTDFLLRALRAGASFYHSNGVVMMRRGGVSDRLWMRAANEYIERLVNFEFLSMGMSIFYRSIVPIRLFARNIGIFNLARKFRTQSYFLSLGAANFIHSILPFFLKKLLYKACRFEIDGSATLQGGVRFFHFGRLQVGPHTIVNRGVYLDNRAGISIGSNVSIAHDAKIYTLGHEINDELFLPKGRSVAVDDYAVIFAGAMIMPGAHIGYGAVVLPGAVVVHDVPAYNIVGGVPARKVGMRDSSPMYRLNRRFWLAH